MPTVLLADDDEDQRYLMGRLLQRAGFETVLVDSGDRVLSAAHTANPDVILLDVQMPGLDGFTTCRQLKDDPRLAAVPVLFLSGRMDERDRRAALEAGADDYLSKGIDARELVRRVQQLARLDR
jgi:CheY-like chemotaxis protein